MESVCMLWPLGEMGITDKCMNSKCILCALINTGKK